jgi:site-specific recombinase XerD
MTLVEKLEYDQQSPALVNFIESLNNVYTKKYYLEYLKKFMKFYRIENAQELLLLDPKVTTENIITFILSCRKAGRAQGTIHQYYVAIKHFYEINDAILNWKKIKKFAGKFTCKRANDRPYFHEEIHKLLEYATFRERVLILLMASAGLRVGALPSLRVGHLEYLEKHGIYKINVYADSEDEKDKYFSFCSKECAAAIDSYINYRKTRLHEEITDDFPLLVNLSDKEKGFNGSVQKIMSVANIQKTISRLLEDTGMRQFLRSY